MNIIISGGGTGGHIYPALAIVDEIKKRYKDANILYVGTEKGLESEIVPEHGVPFKTISAKGLPRKKLNVKTFKTAMSLYKGLRQCDKIIKEFKPDVVIGTGGFVCAPIVMKAQRKKIKTVISEQNAYPGITNKILSKKADLVAINFDEAKEYFDNENIVFTGNPIRSDFEKIDKDEAFKRLGVKNDMPIVLSFGGSGGQESTNDAIIEIIKSRTELPFRLIHITGKVHYKNFMEEIKGIDLPENIKILDYSHKIPDLLKISDLVVASSSAMTLAEISAVGVASILIPKSYTAGNHQFFNAKSYENKGASIVIKESDLSGEVLLDSIESLLMDKNKLEKMGSSSKKLASVDAVKKLVDEILKVIDEK
ncbi:MULTISPECIES: undecaprenyldiphospho-muramoylpentapeptide beta-N-acetylglucosaminyltransferase [Peptoniphilus]|uniref:undecaprenyldiphospho-muramoylpentapeptide beta-N-acetylglucosaminyltransferase n=1 Tax=Peptoniphilus TaxID=162289 RepID=UPI0003B80A84|nr:MULTISPECIES: undecaprenyldiphospho-muramoylpentapeptide beta-N-acetylglucosaminyltransferase [Peptoniphilus]ERT65153.1 undecaprenyldiphospho-muramoylpentapeptide beta-N-acetylglucosaminyltransferase [Peptoniphilus sp. BV3AC2]